MASRQALCTTIQERVMAKYDDTSERYSYVSPLVNAIKNRGGELEVGRLRIRVPRQSGFCWGVDRALAIIDDAIQENPGRTVWLLNEIIHNPRVNRDLENRGVRFVHGPHAANSQGDPKHRGFDAVESEDLIVIPAFSADVEDMQEIEKRGLEYVDTTCPWVIKPHKRTLRYVEDGFTTVIHGTVGHDETRATCSLIAHHGGAYVVVHDLAETDRLCATLRGDVSLETFEREFARALSPGFEARRDLLRLGLINQTTMLASESREVASRIRATLQERHGDSALRDHFRDFDTICRATQDNQDSFLELAADPKTRRADRDRRVRVLQHQEPGAYRRRPRDSGLPRRGPARHPEGHDSAPRSSHRENRNAFQLAATGRPRHGGDDRRGVHS